MSVFLGIRSGSRSCSSLHVDTRRTYGPRTPPHHDNYLARYVQILQIYSAKQRRERVATISQRVGISGSACEHASLASRPTLEFGFQQGDVLGFLRRQFAIELMLGGIVCYRLRALGEERHGALLEDDGRTEQGFRIVDLAGDARLDRCEIDAETVARVRRFDVIAARQSLHVLIFHGGKFCKQRLEHRVGHVAGGAIIKRLSPELDLKRNADCVHRGLVGHAGTVQHLELSSAMGAHAVGKREAFAHFGAALTAPLQRRIRAADVGFVAFQRLVALRAQSGSRHGQLPFPLSQAAGVAASSAAGGANGERLPTGAPGTKASRSSFATGHFALPICNQAPMALAARRPAPMARMTVAPPVTMSPPANTPGRFVHCVSPSAEILPHLLRPRPGVAWPMMGLGLVPSA